MFELILIRTFFVINLACLPCLSLAEEFKQLSISFLGNQVGYIKIREVTSTDTKVIHVDGEIFASPFWVFNGEFNYKTFITSINNASSRIQYESTIDATFKKRKINYTVENDRLLAVDIFPVKEQTKFTNIKQIDFEFYDPASSITKLLSSPCKNSFLIYDGRRVIDITSTRTASKLECRYLYTIRNGPGHLAPLNLKKFEISAFFDQEGNSANKSIMVKTGPFKLILDQVR